MLPPRRRRALFVRQLRRALGPQIHDDGLVRAEWRKVANDPDAQKHAFEQLHMMHARSTGSINNSYLKVQISSGIVVGLIVLFLTVFRTMPRCNWPMLLTGTIMEAMSICMAFLTTTARTTVWVQAVGTPGAFVLQQSREEEYLSLSRRVHDNRRVLLGNRRLAWIATWFLTLPGLAIAVMSWAPLGGTVAIVAAIAWAVLYKKYFKLGRPVGSLEYPAR